MFVLRKLKFTELNVIFIQDIYISMTDFNY